MSHRAPGAEEHADHGAPSAHLLTRRQALAAGGASVLMGGLLAGCGSSGRAAAGAPASQGSPRRGGTLRLGMITGGTSELVIPSESTFPDTLRSNQLYDGLFTLASDGNTRVSQLATEASASKDARVWTFKLRAGVTWHDGRPFTAEDVVYTIKSWAGPTSQTFGSFNGIIDYRSVRARDKLTVEVPLVVPIGAFPELMMVNATTQIVPAGVTATELERKPIGTGPFKYVSFTPGTQSVFARNPDYWDEGKPYVDTLVINTSFTDETARLNAFLAGDVDALPLLPPVEASQIAHESSATLLRADSPIATVFYMDVKRAPFSDVRVRQALRLVIDRQAIVDGALSGYGTIGNDLFGPGAQFFASDLVRNRDVEQAKSLLKAAGQADLRLSLPTSNAVPGFNSAATLFAQQAAAAGITIVPDVGNPSTYYNAPNFPYAFGLDLFSARGGLAAYYNYAFSQFNDTRWGFDKSMSAAVAAYPQASGPWREVQETQFNEGAYIVWGHQDNLDALSKKVQGMTASHVNPMNNYNLNDAYIA